MDLILDEEDSERPDMHVVEPIPMVFSAFSGDVKGEAMADEASAAAQSSIVNGVRITWV